MKLFCQIEAKDYVEAQFIHMRPRPVFKWLGIAILILSLAMGILTALSPREGAAFFVPYILIALPAYFIFLRLILPIKAKKIYRQQRSLQAPFETEISGEGIQNSSEHGTSVLPWEDVHKYKIGKNLVLVYHSDVLFLMMPRRCFSGTQFHQFLDMLRNRVGEPKH
jgi:hypothetical protein